MRKKRYYSNIYISLGFVFILIIINLKKKINLLSFFLLLQVLRFVQYNYHKIIRINVINPILTIILILFSSSK